MKPLKIVLVCLFVTSYMEHTTTTFWARASIESSHKERSQRSKEDIVHYALPFTATEHFLNNASTVTIQTPVTQEGRDRHGREGRLNIGTSWREFHSTRAVETWSGWKMSGVKPPPNLTNFPFTSLYSKWLVQDLDLRCFWMTFHIPSSWDKHDPANHFEKEKKPTLNRNGRVVLGQRGNSCV